MTIFNVPIGEDEYVANVLRNKAEKVGRLARKHTRDLEEGNPHELWTTLQFSLHHRNTYWLRTCTPEETEEMALLVDGVVMEAVYATISINFDQDEGAKNILRLPARLRPISYHEAP